jgi:rhodanese-related sulfurtransferase
VWEALKADPRARLVDVRTPEEWHGVGVADVAAAGTETVLVSWQFGPGRLNPGFLEGMAAAGIGPEHHIYFICRSGARSMAAAEAAQRAGYASVYNVANGFEGAPFHPGWKARELPWRLP